MPDKDNNSEPASPKKYNKERFLNQMFEVFHLLLSVVFPKLKCSHCFTFSCNVTFIFKSCSLLFRAKLVPKLQILVIFLSISSALSSAFVFILELVIKMLTLGILFSFLQFLGLNQSF